MTKEKTERKVVASSWAATIAAFSVGWVVFEVPGLSSMAGPLQALVVSGLTGAAAWGFGWMAKHSPRTPVSTAEERYHQPGM